MVWERGKAKMGNSGMVEGVLRVSMEPNLERGQLCLVYWFLVFRDGVYWVLVGPRSCWAFSTIVVVEGINQIVTGDLISLSEQELVDCDGSYNEGCNGGLRDYAFQFIIKNGGIDSDEDYHYNGRDGQCDQNRVKKCYRVVSIDSYEDVTPYDESALKKATANQPISVAIEAGGKDLEFLN
ncbi:hypothetical protein ACS0TY_016642 [Phlomoides rotata]